jgi:hypothetical protein
MVGDWPASALLNVGVRAFPLVILADGRLSGHPPPAYRGQP